MIILCTFFTKLLSFQANSLVSLKSFLNPVVDIFMADGSLNHMSGLLISYSVTQVSGQRPSDTLGCLFTCTENMFPSYLWIVPGPYATKRSRRFPPRAHIGGLSVSELTEMSEVKSRSINSALHLLQLI